MLGQSIADWYNQAYLDMMQEAQRQRDDYMTQWQNNYLNGTSLDNPSNIVASHYGQINDNSLRRQRDSLIKVERLKQRNNNFNNWMDIFQDMSNIFIDKIQKQPSTT